MTAPHAAPGEVRIPVSGLHCSSCAVGLAKHLSEKGFEGAAVDFFGAVATVNAASPSEVDRALDEIRRAGYVASRPLAGRDRADGAGAHGTRAAYADPSRAVTRRLLFTLPFTAVLLLHMAVPWHPLHDPVVQFFLSLPVVVTAVRHFGPAAAGSLRTGAAGMDLLILIGVVTAFLYSTAGSFIPGLFGGGPEAYLFFETAASVTTFTLLGNVIETRAVARTTDDVRELDEMRPAEATVVRKGPGGERIDRIATRDVTPGLVVQLAAGDSAPADGTVTDGSGFANESLLTGEHAPVPKGGGDRVVAGSVLVSGSVRFRVTEAGGDTVLAGIVTMVEDARKDAPAVQRLGDAVSARFVPAVVLLAGATLAGNLLLSLPPGTAFSRALAVLVVSCPCAMGLATPTAVVVGIGAAARRGILLKGGSVVETLRTVRTVVFDKTGTLTSLTPAVRALTPGAGVDPARFRSLLRGLEDRSGHPLAAVLRAALAGDPPARFEEVSEKAGVGISGVGDDGKTYRAVSAAAAASAGALPPGDPADRAVYLVEGSTLLGTADLEEQVRADAPGAVAALKKAGMRVVLLSGDSHARCERVAGRLGIDEFHAGTSPAGKLDVLKRLSSESPTAFVGDGINDAPALAAATVGVSVASATGAAVRSAKVSVLGGLALVPEAVRLSDVVYRTIKQNLFWALFYNVAAIPLAAAGFLTPTLGAVCMALSDVVVVGNALLLRRKLRRADEPMGVPGA